MALNIGDKIPENLGTDQNGIQLKASNFKGKKLALYFYPKDNTPGCTLEAKHFNRDLKKFKTLDTAIVGISGGDEKSKTSFCSKHKLALTLLSDPDFKTAKAYGAYGDKRFMGKKYKGVFRNTYLLDKRRRVVKVFEGVDPKLHSREVLDYIRGLAGND